MSAYDTPDASRILAKNLSDMQDYMDNTAVSAMQAYIEAQKASTTELEVKSRHCRCMAA